MDLELWKLLVGVATALVGGGWAVFVYFDKRRAGGPAKTGAEASPPVRPATGTQGAALLVVLAGLALCAWALAGVQRPTVNVEAGCGFAFGGDGNFSGPAEVSC